MFVYDQIMQFDIIHVHAHFEMKCKILLHEINMSRLNTIGAGDSTGIERSSPLCNCFFIQRIN